MDATEVAQVPGTYVISAGIGPLYAKGEIAKPKRLAALFLDGISQEAQAGCGRTERRLGLRASYQAQLQAERSAPRLRQALDVLFQQPVLSVRHRQSALGVPFMSAQRYLAKFEQYGLVRAVTGRARNRLYRADAILQALGGPER